MVENPCFLHQRILLMHRSSAFQIFFTVSFLFAGSQQQTLAGCSDQLRILGDSLVNIELSSQQSHVLREKILQAKRFCVQGKEIDAINKINAAREIAGLAHTSGEFDWENIPIEKLNRLPEN